MKLFLAAVLAVTAAGTVAADAAVVERLHYRAVYEGALSVGRPLPIADVELRTTRRAAAAPIRETELAASSENYEVVESLFPMRYRFRSWETDQGLVGFESYRKTRGVHHRLYVRRADGRGFERFELHEGQGREQLGALESGRPGSVAPGDGLIDRLGLLQHVRERRLAVGDVFELPVTGGNKAYRYRVTVEAAQPVEIDGRVVDALKLRFDGFRTDRPGPEERAHVPVYLWVDVRDGHAPLRAESRHPIGVFRVELTGRGLAQLPQVSLR